MDTLIQDIVPLVQELERIERQIEILTFEQTRLRDTLICKLQAERQVQLVVPTEEGRISLRLSKRTSFHYQEDLLRQRLGPRFKCLLAPDPRLLRVHENDCIPLLEPVLLKIGKIARWRVQAGFELGLLRSEEFNGAYERHDKPVLLLRKMPGQAEKPQDAPY